MKKCRKCGAEIPDGAPSCPVCGSPAGDPVIPTPSTGAPQDPQTEKPKKKHTGLKVIGIIVAIFVLMGLIGSCSTSCSKQAENTKYDWPTGSLAQMIPSMNKKCSSVSENDISLSIHTSDRISKNDYTSYIDECKERGFTVDIEEKDNNYEAYNSDGYQVRVSFSDYSDGNEISIYLDAPRTDGDLVWPAYGLAASLPNPNKTKGSISNDSSDTFSAYIGEMDKAAYDAYVNKCIAAGFDVDFHKYQKSYSAENKDGLYLEVSYEGFNTVRVYIRTPYDWESSNDNSSASSNTSSSTNTTPSANTSTNQSTGTSADFKKTMDDYEKTIDSYIAFMKKYSESSNTASMAADYAKYMSDYANVMSEIDAIDENTLTDADKKYYIEVNTRIAKKLADASLE